MRANLVSLQNTNSLLEITQKRLASGKRVNSALDDPVAYFTAVAHEQRAGDLAARKDEMAESIQMVKAADTGIEGIRNLIAAAKSLATSALSAETSADVQTLSSQYHEVLKQIDKLAGDSGYKGVNFLNGDSVTHEIKFDEVGDSKLTITGFDATSEGKTLSLMTFAAGNWWSETGTGTAAAAPSINAAITQLDSATRALRTESSKMSNNLGIITARQEFTQGMINVLKDGAASLTNADMNEEGANMLMLQTRQALGTTSLSLASQAAQSVLRLF
jgi:flagellin-like hook-associated protein FlgL